MFFSQKKLKPKFRYKQKIEIIDGFYAGQVGIINSLEIKDKNYLYNISLIESTQTQQSTTTVPQTTGNTLSGSILGSSQIYGGMMGQYQSYALNPVNVLGFNTYSVKIEEEYLEDYQTNEQKFNKKLTETIK